ncbi:hypothetical protein PF005_g18301 [Phytophthora fragariae]|uniref:RxLR effector protein n=1 Tax=Phytophthora fragariae TaxID=53985 RepID=A0A6A3STY5_9STRA|nr:hypothetical protein PF009_g19067 [Phytophthora fragariae]KAE8992714.1 hypothetical protein PF011_g17449 [Phytophthora fragariae]KAE9093203.1 hypothetical protein PF010_g17569 [Phytophthora fragariae]KAE9093925.1 hypothetical protein PF007_g17948 [Phytophthora fragariae]KAE9123842.1 hypothetical protein PF006_g17335 [Phytophthora fragariae]
MMLIRHLVTVLAVLQLTVSNDLSRPTSVGKLVSS